MQDICTVLYYTGAGYLYCTVLYWCRISVLYCTILVQDICTVLNWCRISVLYCTVLVQDICTVLYWAGAGYLYCTVLCWSRISVLYCTVLVQDICTVLYCAGAGYLLSDSMFWAVINQHVQPSPSRQSPPIRAGLIITTNNKPQLSHVTNMNQSEPVPTDRRLISHNLSWGKENNDIPAAQSPVCYSPPNSASDLDVMIFSKARLLPSLKKWDSNNSNYSKV